MSTPCQLIAPGAVVQGIMSITKSELYFEMDEDAPENNDIGPKVRNRFFAVEEIGNALILLIAFSIHKQPPSVKKPIIEQGL